MKLCLQRILPDLDFFYIFVCYRVQQCIILQVKHLVYAKNKKKIEISNNFYTAKLEKCNIL